MQYITISFDNELTALQILFQAGHKSSCINITILYSPHPSNIRGRQYDSETRYWNITFQRRGLIKSVFMNMNTCDLWNVPLWSLLIDTDRYNIDTLQYSLELNTSQYVYITTVTNCYSDMGDIPQHQFWVMLHFIRPDEIGQSFHGIYLLGILVTNIVSSVSIEVPTDDNQSSSVYGWNHFKGTAGVYITVNKVLNIHFESNTPITKVHSEEWMDLTVVFMRHFIYDERMSKNLAAQSDFTFHNQR